MSSAKLGWHPNGYQPVQRRCWIPSTGERSAEHGAQQSAQVHADAERITIQLQRNAAAEVKLEIQVPAGL